MKKTGLCIAILGIAVSCGTSKEMNASALSKYKCGNRDYFVTNPKNADDSTFVHFNYCFYNLDDPTKKLTDSIVKACIPYKKDTVSTQNKLAIDELYLDCIANSFLSEYAQYAKESDSTFPWFWDASFSFFETKYAVLNMEYSFEIYGGGAHGIFNSSYFPIDLKRNKVIQLKDICKNIPEFTKRAEVLFREQNSLDKLESLESIGFWFENDLFKLTENFKITNDSIIFFYNQYEIAPYAMGTFEIDIPLSSVKDILIIN